MRYAVVADGVVENLIELEERNTADFPEAIPVGERPVAIGDACDGKDFFRSGEKVLTEIERELALKTAQVQALTERNDFIEDCIAEMAMQVYGGV